MLFPLSKSFCATHIFQSGGAYHEQPRKRVWQTDDAESANKTRDLHKLVTSKKPYEEHVALARTYGEIQWEADRERAKSHFAAINEVRSRLDERAKEDRQELRRHNREYKEMRSAREAGLKADLREQVGDFYTWRKDMEARIATNPKLGRDPRPCESEDRAQQREEARRAVRTQTSKYMKEQAAMKKSYSDSIVKFRKGATDETAIEERKAAKAAERSKHLKDWEAHLEKIHDTHSERIAEVRQGHLDRLRETKQRIETQSLSRSDCIEQEKMRGKAEAAALAAKMQNRPKGFCGYTPKSKSDKRLREEEAAIVQG